MLRISHSPRRAGCLRMLSLTAALALMMATCIPAVPAAATSGPAQVTQVGIPFPTHTGSANEQSTPAREPLTAGISSMLAPTGTLAPGDLTAPIPFGIQYPPAGLLAQQPRKPFGTPSADTNPFGALFPELKRAAAPTWLREATRVTYRIQSATIAQSDDVEGSSGAGWVQYDVVALAGGSAVNAVRYFADFGDGNAMPNQVGGLVSLPGYGDYWLSPKVLPNAERVASKELVVLRGPYEVEGQSYDAVRFQYETGGAKFAWVFDEASGILLFHSSDIGTDTSQTRQLSQMMLVKQRQVKLPWRTGAAPGWVRDGSQLRYKGTYATLIPTVQPYVRDLAITVNATGAHDNWTEFSVNTTLAGQSGKGTQVTGAAQLFYGWWLAPEALAALKPGKVIDRDPVTGVQVAVSRGSGGNVVLTETGARFRTALTYDKNGTLLSLDQELDQTATTIQVKLKLTGRK
jgi:hypothetical protein